ncbi:hypothetical protein K443DRAFT_499611 [Laccaria amethystina LaAM-08-1]|uniref:Uncharacterized protein n=1 Tax=Laccaria amethystina LaAM-08-1 TaxID=1095629 RepID=A0A0C9Y531_9AGAR|nr:hypothetical protein K443DRAFT_499611 [Laccaria amethystina LaAM-08-1]
MRQIYLDSDKGSSRGGCEGEGWPSLPIDLLEQILREAWTSLQSLGDKVSLMTSAVLVSKLWLTTFCRVSFRDMVIPCSNFLLQYRRIVQRKSPIYRKLLGDICFTQLCRSIAIQKKFSYPRKHFRCNELTDVDFLYGRSMLESMHLLNSIPSLPLLQVISVIYSNHGCTNLDNGNTFHVYSFSVVNLDIIYIFPPSTPSIFLDAIVQARRCKSPYAPWTPPTVYAISTSKTTAAPCAIGGFLKVCPDMERLDLDECSKGSVEVQVTTNSTSQISQDSIILQGKLGSFRRRTNEKDGTILVQGKTFGIIVEMRKSSSNQMLGLDEPREVHFLRRQVRHTLPIFKSNMW